MSQGDRTITWRDFDRRADGLAATLLDRGAVHQDKVAQYLYNCPEYLESVFAAFKAGLVPVNTNYRYADDELVYLWDNADAVAVVFHGSFAERIERIRDRLPKVATWLWVDDGVGPLPRLGRSTTRRPPPPRPSGSSRRGAGATTTCCSCTPAAPPACPRASCGARTRWSRRWCRAPTRCSGARPTTTPSASCWPTRAPGGSLLPAPPLMHGTGQFTTFITLSHGRRGRPAGSPHLRAGRDARRGRAPGGSSRSSSWATPSPSPCSRALDAEPDRWDLSSLVMVTSSGVMWSEPVKQGLLRHNPNMLLIDVFSSSEALGLGASVSSGERAASTAKFRLGETARVIGDDGPDVEPGSGQTGRVAVKGHTPIGYYKDPEKSAATFVVIDGETYSIPGDYAQVEADGTLTLLGRGSVVHQHRRREGLPRGGRGDPQGAPERGRRRGRGHPRRQVRRGHHRGGPGPARRRARQRPS